MKHILKHIILPVFAIGLILSSCKKDASISIATDQLNDLAKIVIPGENRPGLITPGVQPEKDYNTFYGPVVQMGEGHVRSWANIGHDDIPMAIGIEFTAGVLNQHHEHNPGQASHDHDVLLPLHHKAKEKMPFDHLTMGFMVAGHPPPGIYSVPHFDFHFYKMPLAERLAIPAYPLAQSAFNNNPPTGFLPILYVKAPAGEAQMGAHWMDVTSPEFNGQPFSHTFVYGSYDGRVNFLEPMASLSFLESGATVHKAIRQPQLFDPSNNYYPTRYNIWKNAANNRHYIALDEMMWR